ncbi:Uncharacterised protein [Yersinia pseudotuberculosis]|nr:Uncharacterised protein [Yersinia pseudotuberculosis]
MMNNRFVVVIASILSILIMSAIWVLNYTYVMSYFHMDTEITFSTFVLVGFLSLPVLIYALLSGLVLYILKKKISTPSLWGGVLYCF